MAPLKGLVGDIGTRAPLQALPRSVPPELLRHAGESARVTFGWAGEPRACLCGCRDVAFVLASALLTLQHDARAFELAPFSPHPPSETPASAN